MSILDFFQVENNQNCYLCGESAQTVCEHCEEFICLNCCCIHTENTFIEYNLCLECYDYIKLKEELNA